MNITQLDETGHVYYEHVTTSDCVLRAVVNASGLSYNEVSKRCATWRASARALFGAKAGIISADIPALLAEFFGPVDATRVGHCTLGRWVREHTNGTYLVHTGGKRRKHLFAVRDGQILDWIADTAQRAVVGQVWRLW